MPARPDDPIVLPAPAPPAPRGPFPLVASVVPIGASIAVWSVTGSVLALWFAALGPLLAIAALLDATRGTRRARRRARGERDAALARAADEVRRRHESERVARWRETPDAAALVADPRSRWRGTADALVVGRGAIASGVRVTGGDDDARALRRRAAVLTDAPVAVPLRAGVAVQGDPVLARAVARGLVLQLCLARPPRALRLVRAPAAERGWADSLPHAAAVAASVGPPGAAEGEGGAAVVRLALCDDLTTPAPGDAVIAVVRPGGEAPLACEALLELEGCGRGSLTWRGETEPLDVEGLSLAQARAIARELAERAGPRAADARGAPRVVPLAELLEAAGDAPAVSLEAAIGRDGEHAVRVDLVADGPHAVVVGTTGSGKSELLATWIVSLAASHPPERVTFLLADFKGGAAFAPLAPLPHVTGVLTDLDTAAARRAVESIRAEIRAREAVLASVGARDVADERARLPRLVIVVDEFAAMMQEHPDLHVLFTDIAARGRALGLHLVLGTQRAGGVLRDALVANCPLRIGLRMAEAAESRTLLGEDAAAALPGGAAGRGLAYVRGAGDDRARLMRVALSSPADVQRACERFAGPRARGPWLPPLPHRATREEIVRRAGGPPPGAILLGLADEPERQRQPLVLLRPGRDRGLVVVGGGGAGKSTVAALVAAWAGAVAVPADAEAAWDALDRIEQARPPLVVVDDADALLARLPAEYAHAAGERLEAIVRDAGASGTTVVLTAARLSGAAARVADLLPRRALLALPTRAEHAAAGGEAATFDPRRPPGRAILDGRETQFALVPPLPAAGAHPAVADGARATPWRPEEAVTGVVVRAARARGAGLARAWRGEARVVVLDDVPAGARLAAWVTPGERLVLVGDGDAWQRQWALLQEVRASAPLVVGADCPAELRTIAGERELPPYARTRASRAWLVRPGEPPERVVLP